MFLSGYRGYDCRNNVFMASTGELVYHVAALGIVFDPKCVFHICACICIYAFDCISISFDASFGVQAEGIINALQCIVREDEYECWYYFSFSRCLCIPLLEPICSDSMINTPTIFCA